MLRYFYILICTCLCFCYDYIEENQELSKRNENSNNKNAKHGKSRVIQFDVASFLRNTVTKESQDYEPFDYRNKNQDERTQSEYYYESPLNGNVKKRDENTNYSNIDTDDPKEYSLDPNQQSFQKIVNSEDMFVKNRKNKVNSEPNELLTDTNLIQNPEKKCAFKNMKVPFFSRKPSKAKKQKRKLFCANCARTYTNDVSKSDAKSKTRQLNNKIKRAYSNLCPKCIRKILKRHKLEKPVKTQQIHGSREYYQNIVTAEGNENDKRRNNNDNFEELFSNVRVKRGETEERERQLMELAEVEKKVDHVKVTTPKFNNPNL